MSHKDTMSLNYTSCNGMVHNFFADEGLVVYPKFLQTCHYIDEKCIKIKKISKIKKMLLNGVSMAHFLLIVSRNKTLNRGNEYE